MYLVSSLCLSQTFLSVVPSPYLSPVSFKSQEGLKVQQLKIKRHHVLPLVFQKIKFSTTYANFSRLQTELG